MKISLRHNYLLAIVCGYFLIGCQERQPEVLYDLAIENISVVDTRGNLWEGLYTFYIEGDHIAHITKGEEKLNAPISETIDGTEKFLMAGFWDNHVHFRGGSELIAQNKEFLVHYMTQGITTVRDAGGDLTPEIQKWNEAMKLGQLLGPTIYTSGPKIDGLEARWQGSLAVTDSLSIKRALDSLNGLGTDFVKLYDSTISRESYLQTIRAAEEREMITSGHMPFTVELEEAIAAGLDGVEHLYYILKGCSAKEKEITAQVQAGTLGFWGSMGQLIDTYDTTKAEQLFEVLQKEQVYVIPTLHIGEVLSYLDEVDHRSDPELAYLSKPFIETYQGRIQGALSASEQSKKERKALQQFFNELAFRLADRDVLLLAGSDSGAYNSYVYPGISLHRELAQMVAAGISTASALKTSTFNGSQFLQKTGYELKPDGWADLVILNRNPLDNIDNTREIYGVIKRGAFYSKKTLNNLIQKSINQ